MKTDELRGKDAWVEKINQHEMPAFAATVRSLEKLAEDDTSSLQELGKSVLHDQGLTTRILRVVNSVTYGAGRNSVTTVSKAAVILGYDTLKQICITAKMLDSMMRNRDINEHVHERLVRLMAKSFHSAMLARMLMRDRAEDTQEEVYIAALLHELGEIAFWSMGGKQIEEIDAELRENKVSKDTLMRKILGTSFDQLSVGLASNWNMGEMLIRSIEDPDRRTPEMRAIGLAADYSDVLTNPTTDVNLSSCMKQMSELTGIPVKKLKSKLKKCTEQSVELAVSYGVTALTEYLDPNADLSAFERDEAVNNSDEMAQLKLLRELTLMATEHTDLNLLVNTAIEGLHRGVGMDRVIVFMLNQRKDLMKPRFISCHDAERIERGFVFPLSKANTIFDQVYRKHSSVWIEKPNEDKWQKRMSPAIRALVDEQPFFLSPLMVNWKCLGLIYSDRAETQRTLSSDDFAAFNHFCGQLSLCLSMAVKS